MLVVDLTKRFIKKNIKKLAKYGNIVVFKFDKINGVVVLDKSVYAMILYLIRQFYCRRPGESENESLDEDEKYVCCVIFL